MTATARVNTVNASPPAPASNFAGDMPGGLMLQNQLITDTTDMHIYQTPRRQQQQHAMVASRFSPA